MTVLWLYFSIHRDCRARPLAPFVLISKYSHKSREQTFGSRLGLVWAPISGTVRNPERFFDLHRDTQTIFCEWGFGDTHWMYMS